MLRIFKTKIGFTLYRSNNQLFISYPIVCCVEMHNFNVCILIRIQFFGCSNKAYSKISKLFLLGKITIQKPNATIKKNADICICKFSGSFERYGFECFSSGRLLFEPTKIVKILLKLPTSMHKRFQQFLNQLNNLHTILHSLKVSKYCHCTYNAPNKRKLR